MQLFPETSIKFLDEISGIDGASILEKNGIDRVLTVVMRRGTEVMVGRMMPVPAPNNGHCVNLRNPAISRIHCVLGMDETGTYIKDVGTTAWGSTNGTYVNEKRLEPGRKVYVTENDTITLGKPELPFEVVVRLIAKQRQSRHAEDFLARLRLAVPTSNSRSCSPRVMARFR